MRIYVSGPMTNIPHFNIGRFYAAANKLRGEGNIVFNPAEKDIAEFGKEFFDRNIEGSLEFAREEYGFDLAISIGEDLAWISRHADAIYLLNGWENSKGAIAEFALASVLGLEVMYENEEGAPDEIRIPCP